MATTTNRSKSNAAQGQGRGVFCRLYLVALLLAPLAVLCSGCWDRTEVNDIAIVMTTGVDKEDNGYRVSVMIPLPGNMGGPSGGGGGTGGEKPYTIDSEVGRTLREAVSKLQARLSRRLFFAHRKVYLIGEELAREGMAEPMDIASRVAESRLTSYIAVAKGKAYEVMNTAPKLERFSAEALRELFKSDASLSIQLKDIALRLNGEGSDAILPYVEVKRAEGSKDPNEEVQVTGIAYTRDGKMIGVAKSDQANGIRWLYARAKPYLETVDTGHGLVSVLIRRGKASIRPNVVGQELHYDIRVTAEGTILEALDGREYENEANIRRLEERIEKQILKELEAVSTIITEKRSDVAGFGSILARTYPRRWETEWKPDWRDWLGRLKLHVAVQVNVNRTGMFSRNIGEKGRRRE